MEILCFYAGMAFVYLNQCYALLFIAIVLFFRPKKIFLYAFILAILWGWLHQFLVSPRGMLPQKMIPKALLVGEITSIPVRNGDTVQFTFLAHQLNGKAVKSNLNLSCYKDCPEVHAGQHWQLIAKLKKPRNYGNPGRFDYVSWLNARHIDEVGTVSRGSFKRIKGAQPSSKLLQFREHLCDKLAKLNPDEKTLGILQALTIGVNSYIGKPDWDLFRHTGVTHLIDISGAHIGLIAGITFFITRWMWVRIGTICLYFPAPTVASLAALLLAFIYTLLSGFAIPAQRAFLMCAFMLMRYIGSRSFGIWQAWRYALLLVLIFEPHSVLLAGFYLSFLGVVILILVNQRIGRVNIICKTLLLQLACIIGLMPLSLFWFSYSAMNALLANMFAIPWVELWVVPLGLMTTVLPLSLFSSWIMTLLKKSISLLLSFLHWVDYFSWLNLTYSLNDITAPLILMMALCVVFLPFRTLIVPIGIMSIAAITPYQAMIRPGTAQIDIMDIGQGLAVVVRTAHHVLIYDTGMKFFQGGDMAKRVIIPYLTTLSVKQLDKVVISHPDLDHRGGLNSLQESYPIHELIVDSPEFYHRGLSCHDYPEWSWDGVSFRFFAIKGLNKKNNHSCVLRIATSAKQLLLTGDIEKTAEDYLVATYGHELSSTFMVIPHHASRTSSTALWVETVAPKYAIASYGFDNRYHFPHQQAINTYRQRQIPIYNTVECGMVSIRLDETLKTHQPSSYFNCVVKPY